jgi:small conductance mechanosensitive channel
MNTNFSTILEKYLPLIIQYSLKVLGAFVILFLGIWISRIVSKRIRNAMLKIDKIDNTLAPVVANATRILIVIITLLAVLSQFGIQTTSFIAVLGAAGLAIGLALQGTLSNVASGTMLLILRPFKMGDVVKVNGNICVVDEIGLFISKFKSFDGISIYLPNSSIWGAEIQNLTENPTRRTDIIIGISYTDDINKAFVAVKDELTKENRILTEPEHFIAVESLGDSSVNILVRFWTSTSDAYPTKLDMTKKLKERFDADKITIPFPQRDIHLFQQTNN